MPTEAKIQTPLERLRAALNDEPFGAVCVERAVIGSTKKYHSIFEYWVGFGNACMVLREHRNGHGYTLAWDVYTSAQGNAYETVDKTLAMFRAAVKTS